ncbi:type I methionyl aminopeptidase [Shouchella clausii]|jgi:methionyl aminopeptidase|uniref:Methionine aminopeptidase n=1 Tax=Shouchella clausii TaxID=79880 RepID=A0A268RY25_SHOCL|nr:type I methionyl aminopeptidase [Shouchella clausii]PAD42162.1 type I methionyl aminopeptidase [Bacillus sp. 7520-S]SPU18687.1 methionine aminopeptidase [Niallia circulans]AST95479.1 type I methionyl aminopeptidase [Shouchella clausii]MBU8598052.1 type I methionyl aminopeptidase [Shouchella clausii]MCM3550434.1 type I methionyl aminopeptidase [Shouchella clausii]
MIVIKTERELDVMRKAGQIVALTHAHLKPYIKPGITTGELDALAEAFIRSHDATPSFLGYGGFTGSICASVNEELVHGIPGDRVLADGDVISLDIGAYYNGYHGDSAWTYGVGTIKEEDQKLLDATEASLYKGLELARPGNRLSDISHAVQTYVEQSGYAVVREYAGHGIGKDLHEDPNIPNYGPPGKGPKLKPGMVLAIEPMVNAGSRYVRTLADNWTVVTVDKKNCAHFEHTVAITETGYEILTKA